MTTEESGLDFGSLLSSLGLQVGVISPKKLTHMDRRHLNAYMYDPYY